MSNAEEFGDWLAEVRGNHEVVVSEHRPVPLWQHVLVGHHDVRPVRRATARGVNPDLVAAIRTSEQRGRSDDDRGAGRRDAAGYRRRGVATGARRPERPSAPRGPGGGAGGRGLRPRRTARRGRDPGRGHHGARPRRAAARRSPSSSAGWGARRAVGQLLGRPAPGWSPRREGRASGGTVEERLGLAGRGGPVGARLLRLRRGADSRGFAAHHAGHAAAVPGDRRGAVHHRPDPGRVRHRDPRPRASTCRPARSSWRSWSSSTARPTSTSRLPSTPSSPAAPGAAASTSRATRSCSGPVASTRCRSPGWRRPGPTRCARASGPPTTWRSTWSPRSVARWPARSWRPRSPSSRPTARSSGIAPAIRRTRRRWRATPRRCTATSATSASTPPCATRSREAEKEGAKARSASRRAEAAVSLEALRIGDVIRVPAGRRAG